MIKCYKWGACNVTWADADWLWSECRFIQDLYVGIDATEVYRDDKWNQDLEKKKRFIRLICNVKNTTYDESKEVKDIKIEAEDVKLVMKTVLNIELEIKET